MTNELSQWNPASNPEMLGIEANKSLSQCLTHLSLLVVLVTKPRLNGFSGNKQVRMAGTHVGRKVEGSNPKQAKIFSYEISAKVETCSTILSSITCAICKICAITSLCVRVSYLINQRALGWAQKSII